jgi:hypothetical protein
MWQTGAVFPKAAGGLKVMPIILAATDEPARIDKHHHCEGCDQRDPPGARSSSVARLDQFPHRYSPRTAIPPALCS